MSTSYNGWPASDDRDSIGVDPDFTVAGVTFPGGVKAGDVAKVLGYCAQAWHDRIEPLTPGWCWGHNYRANVNNPSTLSCHSSGTALDINAPTKPNGGSRYGNLSDAQVAEVRRILVEVEDAVGWGADFTTYDPMHLEIEVDADTLAGVASRLSTGADMGLTADDKDWLAAEIRSEVGRLLTADLLVSTDDEAADGNPNKYTLAGGVGRAIRLTSFTATGQVLKPHD